MKPLSAGTEVDSWCTKCRMDLSHRIVAMVGAKPKRVECQTCGSQHNYRSPKTSGAGVTVRKKATTKSGAPKARETQKARTESARLQEWEKRTSGHVLDAFTRYSIGSVFALDELITHKRFGEGYVVEILDAQKVSIMFRDGPRTLAQGSS